MMSFQLQVLDKRLFEFLNRSNRWWIGRWNEGAVDQCSVRRVQLVRLLEGYHEIVDEFQARSSVFGALSSTCSGGSQDLLLPAQ